MKKLFFSLAILAVLTVAAEPVTPERAAKVARNFMAQTLGSKAPVELTLHEDNWFYVGFYLFEGTHGGWVIVAADDCVKPILGYSSTGSLDPSNMPPALRRWLGGYEEQIAAVYRARAAKSPIPVYENDAAEWRRLEAGIADGTKDGDGVAPMLTTRWDQDYPFDAYTPGNTVTGCAATALAQFMKFWNYPAFGRGSHSYVAPRTGTTESADFGHTLYDWAHMPDRAAQYDTQEEIAAVSTLMYHCGVSIDMDYGTASQGGSAALGLAGIEGYSSQDNALKDYFCYSRDMSVHFKDYGYTNDSWRELLVAELDLGHPILYAGAATEGGHGFICDGYDSRQYMHFNFGWSGLGDGYYPVDSISPGHGGVGGNVTYTFNMQNACLIGAVPDYALCVSDTIFNYTCNGGTDSLLVGINETNNGLLEVSCSADWISVEHDEIGRAGWVRLVVSPMNDGSERTANVVFSQGNERVVVRVAQVNYSEEDMCSVKVVMENTSTHHDGWYDGAFLTLESEGGFLFGKARLEEGQKDTVEYLVAPHDIKAVWHSGGGTDRYVNYCIYNQHGQELVKVVNAYRNGGTHHIAETCELLGIEEAVRHDEQVYPTPAHNILNIRAERLQKVEIIDLSGRKVAESTHASIDISQLHNGHYFVRIVTSTGTSVKRFVKK